MSGGQGVRADGPTAAAEPAVPGSGITTYTRGAVRPLPPDAGVLEPPPRHPGWSTFLSHRTVRAIAVAPSSGHLWAATWGGVLSWNRREEHLYRRYSSEHGLGGTPSCLCLDDAEQPWVGHVEGGISSLDGPLWRAADHLPDTPVVALCRAPGGGIWLAGPGAVYRMTGLEAAPLPLLEDHDAVTDVLALAPEAEGVLTGTATGLWRVQAGREPVRVAPEQVTACTALATTASGDLWIGTPGAVVRRGRGGGMDVFPVPTELSDGRVVAITAGSSAVWVLATTGLAHLHDGRWDMVPISGAPALARALASAPEDGYLWVGTDAHLAGLAWVGAEPHWSRLVPEHPGDSLSNLALCAAASPGADRVWIGTAGGLVACGPGTQWTLDADVGYVDAVCATRDAAGQSVLWMLTRPGGVHYLVGPNGITTPAPALIGLPTALGAGSDGSAYIVARGKLWRLCTISDTPEVVSTDLPTQVNCLAEMEDGRIWVGTPRGPFLFTGGRWMPALQAPPLAQSAVYALLPLGTTLWAATSSGLWAWRDGAWAPHAAATDGARGHVTALADSPSRGVLWLARADGVVGYGPQAGTIEGPYTPLNSGLCSRRITGLAEAGSALWIATRAGISRFDLETPA